MAFLLREMDCPFPEEQFQKISSRNIKKAILKIQKCSDLDFQCMQEERIAVTAVTDAESRWNFPKI